MPSNNTLTLTALTTQIQERADMVNSNFVSSAEWTAYINQSYQELYDILVQKYGDDYFVSNSTFVTDGVNQLFSLPADFQKLLGVDLQLSTTTDSFVTLRPFNFSDRNRYSVPNFQSFYGVTNMRYRLQGSNLWLTPIPASGQTIQVWYVPQLQPLVSGSDIANNLGGWLEYVIVDVCIKALAKEESDVSVFMAQKQALIQRIEAAAENRDAGSPATVSDAQYTDFRYPTGSNGTGGSF